MSGIHDPRHWVFSVDWCQKHFSSHWTALCWSIFEHLLSLLAIILKCWAFNLISISSITLIYMYSTRPDVCILISVLSDLCNKLFLVTLLNEEMNYRTTFALFALWSNILFLPVKFSFGSWMNICHPGGISLVESFIVEMSWCKIIEKP